MKIEIRKPIIALDFDGVLSTAEYPDIELDMELIEVLRLYNPYVDYVLYTCREDCYLKAAYDEISKHLFIEAVNTDVHETFRGFKRGGKVYYDLLFDDKSFLWERDLKKIEHAIIDVIYDNKIEARELVDELLGEICTD